MENCFLYKKKKRRERNFAKEFKYKIKPLTNFFKNQTIWSDDIYHRKFEQKWYFFSDKFN